MSIRNVRSPASATVPAAIVAAVLAALCFLTGRPTRGFAFLGAAAIALVGGWVMATVKESVGERH